MEISEINVEKKAVNTLRALAAEAISNANSGHSGIALGAAPIMYAAYKEMNVDPTNPAWFNRDRFVLSAGHGSALLYATLHSFGFNGIDLKTFRQMNSPLTGHPELDEKIGVDCSTGPLGQGIAMAVGIALAEKKLAATYNTENSKVVNHHTFCLVGDGCLQEGISYEACNLAGLWKLNKLIVLYDSNKVTLDGSLENTDVKNVAKRFQSMNWNVVIVKDGNDESTISAAIKRAKRSVNAPTLVIIETEIGYGAKNSGTNKAHGQVLSREDIAKLREEWGLNSMPFEVCDEVRNHFAEIIRKKSRNFKKWKKLVTQYAASEPEKYKNFCEFFKKPIKKYECEVPEKSMALRDAGQIMLNQIAKTNPRLWGGSADVASTTKAFIQDGGLFSHEFPTGNDIAFGIREFAMAAICNGLALHGFTPYCSTFLAFSDYAKPAIRLTAMMNLPVTYIFSHDGLGNAPDGPTHQATEHIAALRLIPNMNVFRPSDNYETAAVYEHVFGNYHPACIILGRGSVPNPSGCNEKFEKPQAIIMSSGAEVSICVQTQELLEKNGIEVNVLSVPCLDGLDAKKLDKNIPILAVEMGSGMPWWAFFGKHGFKGDVVSFDDFGASAKESELLEKLGFTPIALAEKIVQLLSMIAE